MRNNLTNGTGLRFVALVLLLIGAVGCDGWNPFASDNGPDDSHYQENRFAVRVLEQVDGGPPVVGHCVWLDTGASGKFQLGATDASGMAGRNANGEGTKLSIPDGWGSTGAREVKVWTKDCDGICGSGPLGGSCYSTTSAFVAVTWETQNGQSYWVAEVFVSKV